MACSVRESGMREVALSEIEDDLSRFLREAELQEILSRGMASRPAC